MAEKKTQTDEGNGGTAVAERPTQVLPCLGGCRGDTDHEVNEKVAACTACDFERRTDVGPGSPEGPRWFVTKYPSWTTNPVPEDILIVEGGRTVKQKGVRLRFKKVVKPRKLVSTTGVLGSENPDGGDMNACRWLGVYEIVNPGDKPTTKNEILARTIIDFLRGHEYYRKTAQDNRLSPNPELIELTWDPTLRKTANGVAVNRRVSLDQHDEEAPLDEAPRPAKARVGLMRRKPSPHAVSALQEGE